MEPSDPAFAATQALAHAPDVGVLCIDVDLIIRSVQGSIFSPLGRSHEELVERSLADVLRGSELVELRSCCEAALRGEDDSLHIPSVDGTARLEITVNPVRVRDSTIVGAIAIARRATMTVTVDACEARLRILPGDRDLPVYA